jgi:hypothetical protein
MREEMKTLKTFHGFKRQGNYREALGEQGHLSNMSNIAF